MDGSDSGNWLKSVFLKLILDRQMNEPTKICVLRVFFANEKSYVIFLLRNIQLLFVSFYPNVLLKTIFHIFIPLFFVQ